MSRFLEGEGIDDSSGESDSKSLDGVSNDPAKLSSSTRLKMKPNPKEKAAGQSEEATRPLEKLKRQKKKS